MPTVAWIDVATIVHKAGFPSGTAQSEAVALTQPESGRNPQAVNSSDPNGGSFGLWQINGVHDPAATGEYPNKVPTEAWIAKMFDPVENGRVALGVWQRAGQTFKPWGAYTNNLHKPFLPIAVVALDARVRIARLEITVAKQAAQVTELEANLLAASALLGQAEGRIVNGREYVRLAGVALA